MLDPRHIGWPRRVHHSSRWRRHCRLSAGQSQQAQSEQWPAPSKRDWQSCSHGSAVDAKPTQKRDGGPVQRLQDSKRTKRPKSSSWPLPLFVGLKDAGDGLHAVVVGEGLLAVPAKGLEYWAIVDREQGGIFTARHVQVLVVGPVGNHQ